MQMTDDKHNLHRVCACAHFLARLRRPFNGSRSVSKAEQTKSPEVYSGVCFLSHRTLSVEVRVLSHQLVIRLARSLGNRLQSSVVVNKSCSECLRFRLAYLLRYVAR